MNKDECLNTHWFLSLHNARSKIEQCRIDTLTLNTEKIINDRESTIQGVLL